MHVYKFDMNFRILSFGWLCRNCLDVCRHALPFSSLYISTGFARAVWIRSATNEDTTRNTFQDIWFLANSIWRYAFVTLCLHGMIKSFLKWQFSLIPIYYERGLTTVSASLLAICAKSELYFLYHVIIFFIRIIMNFHAKLFVQKSPVYYIGLNSFKLFCGLHEDLKTLPIEIGIWVLAFNLKHFPFIGFLRYCCLWKKWVILSSIMSFDLR